MKKLLFLLCAISMLMPLGGCAPEASKVPNIGVSFGVGEAIRWVNEAQYMEDRAAEVGADIEVRLNKTDLPKTQLEDCKEMIDSGIDVLILIPRDASKAGEIMDYAKEKGVPVISYARIVLGQPLDLFVGYDSGRIGQSIGQYVTEYVYEGDYIILKGDEQDNNATLLYEGNLVYVDPLREKLNILLEAAVPNWSPEEAKAMVKKAVSENGNHVDAILAPNDKIAGSCAEALAELGMTDPVVITGMDAELDAVRRIVAGTQSMTIYMELRELASTAIDQACNIALGKEVETNSEFNNQSDALIPANLISGRVITKENVDKLLIDTGHFTREQVYGP